MVTKFPASRLKKRNQPTLKPRWIFYTSEPTLGRWVDVTDLALVDMTDDHLPEMWSQHIWQATLLKHGDTSVTMLTGFPFEHFPSDCWWLVDAKALTDPPSHDHSHWRSSTRPDRRSHPRGHVACSGNTRLWALRVMCAMYYSHGRFIHVAQT